MTALPLSSIFNTIDQSSIFKNLTASEKESVAKAAHVVEYKAGETIFKMDSTDCDCFYIIHSGEINLTLKDGRRKRYSPTDIFGEVAIFDQNYRSGTIEAATAVVLLEIHKDFVRKSEGTNTLTAVKVANALTNQIISYLEEVQEVSSEELIHKGENEQMEFKSSLSKTLKPAILRAITAFMNHAGGSVFIGVKDDGKIIGLKSTPEKIDGYRNSLMGLISQRIGSYYATLIRCHVETIREKQVLRITCLPSTKPAFLNEKANGKWDEQFYVRQDATNKCYAEKSAIANYVIERFSRN